MSSSTQVKEAEEGITESYTKAEEGLAESYTKAYIYINPKP